MVDTLSREHELFYDSTVESSDGRLAALCCCGGWSLLSHSTEEILFSYLDHLREPGKPGE